MSWGCSPGPLAEHTGPPGAGSCEEVVPRRPMHLGRPQDALPRLPQARPELCVITPGLPTRVGKKPYCKGQTVKPCQEPPPLCPQGNECLR